MGTTPRGVHSWGALDGVERRIEERVSLVQKEIDQETERNVLIMLGLFCLLFGVAVLSVYLRTNLAGTLRCESACRSKPYLRMLSTSDPEIIPRMYEVY